MEKKPYILPGQVVDRHSKEGVYNVRVEAWSTDSNCNSMVGAAFTDDDGHFKMYLDPGFFSAEDTIAPAGRSPSLYFKAYLFQALLATTTPETLAGIADRGSALIMVEMPENKRPQGKDRLSPQKAFDMVNFFRQSDFKGVYEEFRCKAKEPLRVVSDMLVNTVTKMDYSKPLKVEGPRCAELLNQDVEKVRKKLAEHKIEVVGVQPYNPRLNRTSVKALYTSPIALRPGQQVILFEAQGKVKHVALARAETPVERAELLDQQNRKLTVMAEELETTRVQLASKDRELESLRAEMKAVQEQQAKINTLLESADFQRIIRAAEEGQPRRTTRRRANDPPPNDPPQ